MIVKTCLVVKKKMISRIKKVFEKKSSIGTSFVLPGGNLVHSIIHNLILFLDIEGNHTLTHLNTYLL